MKQVEISPAKDEGELVALPPRSVGETDVLLEPVEHLTEGLGPPPALGVFKPLRAGTALSAWELCDRRSSCGLVFIGEFHEIPLCPLQTIN